MNKRSLALSIAVHTLIALSLSFKGCGGGTSSSNGSLPPMPKEEAIVEKSEVDIELIEIDASLGKKKPKHANVECPGSSYGGIGVYTTSTAPCVVTKVVAGYPAADAELVQGDTIVDPGCNDIRGSIGTEVDLTVVRHSTGAVEYIKLIRDKICTGEGDLPVDPPSP